MRDVFTQRADIDLDLAVCLIVLCLGLGRATARTVLDILSEIFPIISSIIDKQFWFLP